jgi:cytochrome P450
MPANQSTYREAQDVIAALHAPGLEDPYPLYTWLRENAPVVHSEWHDAYLLSRFADCTTVFRDSELFHTTEHDTLLEFMPQAVVHQQYRMLFASLLDGKPLPYTPIRQLIATMLTPDVVRYIRDGMRDIRDEVLAAVAAADDGRPIDLHNAISVPICQRALAALIGVPEADFARASKLIPHMMQVMQAAPTQAALVEAQDAFTALADYMTELLAHSRKSPGSNLVTLMSHDGPHGPALSDDEIRTTLLTLWATGLEKSVITIDTAVLAVLRQPRLIDWVRDEETAAAFVDELYRWDSPGQISTSPRYVAADTEIDGYPIPAGAEVRMLLGAANRDPLAYHEPGRLQPSRIGPTAMMSGAGFQLCVGTSLARLMMCILLPGLVERFPELHLAGEPVWRGSLPLRELRSIPVRLRSGVPAGIGAH